VLQGPDKGRRFELPDSATLVGRESRQLPLIDNTVYTGLATELGGKPEQLDTLRSAFDATVHDPEFLKDAETIRIDISPLSGAKVQDLVAKLYAAPKDIVVRARQAISP